MTPNSVRTEDGEQMRAEINANQFLECSAKNYENINEVIYEAVRASVAGRPEMESDSSCWDALGALSICAMLSSLFSSSNNDND